MLSIIGFIGSLSMAIASIPQAVKCYTQGHARGVSLGTLLLWMVGILCMPTYLTIKNGPDFYVFLSYGVDFLSVGCILKYKFWERS